MTTVATHNPKGKRLIDLLGRALDPATPAPESETSAVHLIRHARREQMTISSLAEAIAPPDHQLPPPKNDRWDDATPAVAMNRMPFGKYRGETMRWIAQNDYSYLEWMALELDGRMGRVAQQVIECIAEGWQP